MEGPLLQNIGFFFLVFHFMLGIYFAFIWVSVSVLFDSKRNLLLRSKMRQSMACHERLPPYMPDFILQIDIDFQFKSSRIHSSVLYSYFVHGMH